MCTCSAFGKSKEALYAVHFNGSNFSKSWDYLEIMILAMLQLHVLSAGISEIKSLSITLKL